MATFRFELVAPERVLFSGEVEAVELPATDGDMTVLPGHAPAMTTLKTGFVVLTERSNQGRRVLVQGGFADVGPSGTTVLAERALPVEEITQDILDQEIVRAQMSYDSTDDVATKQAAEAMIAQLNEAKATLRL
jgi:F-type H+-transporting ATPase subunit epsilon